MQTPPTENDPQPESRLKALAWAVFYAGFGCVFLSCTLQALMAAQAKPPFVPTAWTWADRPILFALAIGVLVLVTATNFYLAAERLQSARPFRRSA